MLPFSIWDLTNLTFSKPLWYEGNFSKCHRLHNLRTIDFLSQQLTLKFTVNFAAQGGDASWYLCITSSPSYQLALKTEQPKLCVFVPVRGIVNVTSLICLFIYRHSQPAAAILKWRLLSLEAIMRRTHSFPINSDIINVCCVLALRISVHWMRE